MGWASEHIAKLKMGEPVQFCPFGRSMTGRVTHGQQVTVAPVDPASLAVDDIVLCSVNGNQYLHLINDAKMVDFKSATTRAASMAGSAQIESMGVSLSIHKDQIISLPMVGWSSIGTDNMCHEAVFHRVRIFRPQNAKLFH